MGDLLSLFWEVDPPPMPISFAIPSQDAECRKDESCGTIGSFLLWYFVIILILMLFSRASVWMSESKRDEDSGTSASVSRASKETSYKRQSKDGPWDSSQVMKKPKQNQLSTVTDSEVALVNAYLEQRGGRRHSQFHRVNQTQQDSDSTECDSEESNSGASSWKESESEHHPLPTSIKRRKPVSRPREVVENYQIRERPCLHCKAMRTNEWLTRHFPPSTSVTTPMKGEIQEENLTPSINTKLSKF
ncbi:serine-rich single-pass membrane protein 1 [Cricetulus griseus]|uniref:Serine-rich single-pass membrane protein 1 n=2 Tax=Cricetulus griseus TaxID=10029 RepID=A0A8C2LX43_CRIGR|nr:serine-rich single-pass membrane protein 1 [Cricetulus griseus]XP_027247106.1 serine-rich single-pass membrane protein 1 [Cricetulus griseus]